MPRQVSIPSEQSRLRCALIDGDLKRVQQLLGRAPPSEPALTGTTSSWLFWRKSSHPLASAAVGKGKPSARHIPRLDFCYEDDYGASALMYLALGSLLKASALAPAHRPSHQQQESAYWSWFTGGQESGTRYQDICHASQRTLQGRLVILEWLLSEEQSDLWPQLAVTCVTHRGECVLHAALYNGGNTRLLSALLMWLGWGQGGSSTPGATGYLAADSLTGVAPTSSTPPINSSTSMLRPAVRQEVVPLLQLEDYQGLTPLDVSLAAGQWEAAALLIGAGALKASMRLRQAHATVASLMPPICQIHGVSLIQGQPALSQQPSSSLVSMLAKAASSLPKGLGQLFQGLTSAPGSEVVVAIEAQVEAWLLQGPSSLGQGQGGLALLSKQGTTSQLCHSLDAEGVLKCMQSSLMELSKALQVDESTATRLLLQHRFDSAAARSEGIVSPTDAPASASSVANASLASVTQPSLAAGRSHASILGTGPHSTVAGGGGPETQPCGLTQGIAKCCVCFEFGRLSETARHSGSAGPAAAQIIADPGVTFGVNLPCGHHTCDTCWKGILRARLDDGQPHAMCPVPGCGYPLPMPEAQRLLDTAQLGKWNRLLARDYVTQHPGASFCPRPGCGYSVHLQGSVTGAGEPGSLLQTAAERGLAVQCSCGHRFCFACHDAPHEPASCEQMRAWRRLLQEEQQAGEADTERWLTGNTQKCPRCRASIAKDGGCNHMRCTVCRAEFCWVCLTDWSQHNRGTGGYYQCNRAAAAGAGGAGGAGTPGAAAGGQQQGAPPAAAPAAAVVQQPGRVRLAALGAAAVEHGAGTAWAALGRLLMMMDPVAMPLPGYPVYEAPTWLPLLIASLLPVPPALQQRLREYQLNAWVWGRMWDLAAQAARLWGAGRWQQQLGGLGLLDSGTDCMAGIRRFLAGTAPGSRQRLQLHLSRFLAQEQAMPGRTRALVGRIAWLYCLSRGAGNTPGCTCCALHGPEETGGVLAAAQGSSGERDAVVATLQLLQDWVAGVALSREVLAHSYIVAYYCTARGPQRYLEGLQAKLLACIEALMRPLDRLPHSSSVPMSAPSSASSSTAGTSSVTTSSLTSAVAAASRGPQQEQNVSGPPPAAAGRARSTSRRVRAALSSSSSSSRPQSSSTTTSFLRALLPGPAASSRAAAPAVREGSSSGGSATASRQPGVVGPQQGTQLQAHMFRPVTGQQCSSHQPLCVPLAPPTVPSSVSVSRQEVAEQLAYVAALLEAHAPSIRAQLQEALRLRAVITRVSSSDYFEPFRDKQSPPSPVVSGPASSSTASPGEQGQQSEGQVGSTPQQPVPLTAGTGVTPPAAPDRPAEQATVSTLAASAYETLVQVHAAVARSLPAASWTLGMVGRLAVPALLIMYRPRRE